MGIKNFRKFIDPKMDNVTTQISFADGSKYIRTICIDINIFIYKFVTAIRRSTGHDLTHDGRITSHIIGLRNQLAKFTELGIKVIYVFDGNAPIEKSDVLAKRDNVKKYAIKKYEDGDTAYFNRTFSITPAIIHDAMTYLKLSGCAYVYVPTMEADIVCATLVKKRYADCVLSTDYDILAYGARYLIINMDYKKKVFDIIDLTRILKSLTISYDQFVVMVALSGCDYCEPSANMTLNKAYKLVKDNPDFATLLEPESPAARAYTIFTSRIKFNKSIINHNKRNEKKLREFIENIGLHKT